MRMKIETLRKGEVCYLHNYLHCTSKCDKKITSLKYVSIHLTFARLQIIMILKTIKREADTNPKNTLTFKKMWKSTSLFAGRIISTNHTWYIAAGTQNTHRASLHVFAHISLLSTWLESHSSTSFFFWLTDEMWFPCRLLYNRNSKEIKSMNRFTVWPTDIL